jgi:hypothetical protein
MLEIENKDRFGKVIADSLSKIELTVTDSQTKKRWINAIAKATVEIKQNGVFMTWQQEDHSLLIWSQRSNNIYTANGVCQCRAFEQGSPCFHRAAARLVRLYMEMENAPVQIKEVKEIPYLPNTKEPVRVEKYGSVKLPVYN